MMNGDFELSMALFFALIIFIAGLLLGLQQADLNTEQLINIDDCVTEMSQNRMAPKEGWDMYAEYCKDNI